MCPVPYHLAADKPVTIATDDGTPIFAIGIISAFEIPPLACSFLSEAFSTGSEPIVPPAADIWTFGVNLCEVLSKRSLF